MDCPGVTGGAVQTSRVAKAYLPADDDTGPARDGALLHPAAWVSHFPISESCTAVIPPALPCLCLLHPDARKPWQHHGGLDEVDSLTHSPARHGPRPPPLRHTRVVNAALSDVPHTSTQHARPSAGDFPGHAPRQPRPRLRIRRQPPWRVSAADQAACRPGRHRSRRADGPQFDQPVPPPDGKVLPRGPGRPGRLVRWLDRLVVRACPICDKLLLGVAVRPHRTEARHHHWHVLDAPVLCGFWLLSHSVAGDISASLHGSGQWQCRRCLDVSRRDH